MTRLIISSIFAATLATSSARAQEVTYGHLLLVWIGNNSHQALSLVTFEGENSAERCEAARAALRLQHSSFRNDWIRCVPF